MPPVVLLKTTLQLKKVSCWGVCMCVHLTMDSCCVNKLHYLLQMSLTSRFQQTLLWIPHSFFLLHLLPTLDGTHSSSICCFQRLHSLYYLTPHSISHKPSSTLSLHHMHTSNYRVGMLYQCQTVIPRFPFSSFSFFPFLLFVPGRLGYALITLSILPSCQTPSRRVVTAEGHHGNLASCGCQRRRCSSSLSAGDSSGCNKEEWLGPVC